MTAGPPRDPNGLQPPDPPAAPAWRRDRLAARLPVLRARAAMMRAWRDWFAEAGFLEVETPALQIAPGAEVHLQAFWTDFALGGRPTRYGLHTSPEFAMKKLLAGGLTRICQFAPVFRNGEWSATHHPAFTMLEWYRAGDGSAGALAPLIADCRALLRTAAAVAEAEGAGDGLLRWGEASADPTAAWEILTVAEAFARHAGIDLAALIDDPADPSPAPLAEAARNLGLTPAADDSFDDVFFRIFLDRIEPHLGQGRPTVLTRYPISMAALSRPADDDPRWADRFELYVAGLELANAFGELTDPVEQARRFEADLDRKAELYGEVWPIDRDFLAALDPAMGGGLPPTAGIALGVDRLVMLATGRTRIADVLWLPMAAPWDAPPI